MLSDSTVDHVRAKHVSVRSTGHEKTRINSYVFNKSCRAKSSNYYLKRKRSLPMLEKMFSGLMIDIGLMNGI